MSTPKLIDVSKLQDATTIYDKALRTLPFVSILEAAAALGLNVMELKGKHTLINERRRAGGTQSYEVDKEFAKLANLIGYEPSDIEPKDVVFITKENSKKYTDNELLVVGGKPTDNKGKRHPMEFSVLSSQTRSHGEDIVYALCNAERDKDSTAPTGAFDGLHTKVDKFIIAGAINVARGNLIITGEFEIPGDGTSTVAYDKLVEFVASTHPMLRSTKGGIPQLQISQHVIKAARAALRNKLKMQEYPTQTRMLELLREDAFCPSLEFATHECLGNGSRLILQKKGNMDLAINTQSAAKFVQVRDIYEDPNTWQFWLQAGYDTRLRDWHEKVFACNEQKNSYLDLSGDYCLTGGVQVNTTGTDAAKWTIDDQTTEHESGSYAINLTPGAHTIKFGAVSGKTKPADQTVTIVEGEVKTVVGAYT
ncbi:MAG: carboxypeptidase-like regulatory domain-containing protein [Phocaeicola sp.]